MDDRVDSLANILPASWDRATFAWAVALLVGYPLLTLVAGELIHRLNKRGGPLAKAVSSVRNFVLPLAAAMILLRPLAGLPAEHPAVRFVTTLFWIGLIHASLLVVNEVLFRQARRGSWRERVPKLLVDIGRVVLVLMGGAVVLSAVWGYNLGGLATALGVGSVVLGLALQEPLGHVFAGVMLLFERPFAPGDWIEVGGKVGNVVEVNWRSVHLQTIEGELVVVPNAELAKGSFLNFSRPSRSVAGRIELQFSMDDPPNRVRTVLLAMANRTEGVLKDPPAWVEVANHEECGILYRLHFNVADFPALQQVRSELRARSWYLARRRGLTFPFPTSIELGHDPDEYEKARTPDVGRIIRSFPHLLGRDEQLLADLAKRAKVASYARGEAVVFEGEQPCGLHIVVKGQAAILVADQAGDFREIDRVSRGEYFGEGSLLDDDESEATIRAVDDLEVLLLETGDYERLINQVPRLAREVGRVLDARRKAAQEIRRPQPALSTPPAPLPEDDDEPVPAGRS